MKNVFWRRTAVLLAGTILAWFGFRFLLPIALPFLLGGLLAVAAEPAVSFGTGRLKLPRSLASVLGVGLSLLILTGILLLLGGLAVRQLGAMAQKLPDMDDTLQMAENALLSVAEKAPPRLRVLAERTVHETLDDGAALLSGVAEQLPGAVGTLVGGIADSALRIGTGILAAFLISLRLPRLRSLAREKLPSSWHEKYLPALRRFRNCIWNWVKAQGKLALVTWGIVTVGFWVLGIGKAPFWAFLVALLDAVPVLGTGTVLLPWAAVSLLQQQTLRAVGLVCLWGVSAITRTVLEPRVVGRHLGLDPLLTLVAMYTGFCFWGIGGMLLTPILASAVKSAVTIQE